jgi:hypothetical protein
MTNLKYLVAALARWRNAAKELTGIIPSGWMTLTRTQVALCATGGLLCLLALPFVPCLAEGNHNGGVSAGSRVGFRDDTCCSNEAYTSNARYRIKNGLNKYQPQPFFKGQILSAFGRDIMHSLGLDQPAQRGDWTVGGFGFGAVTHEMRGPGGTIGPI